MLGTHCIFILTFWDFFQFCMFIISLLKEVQGVYRNHRVRPCRLVSARNFMIWRAYHIWHMVVSPWDKVFHTFMTPVWPWPFTSRSNLLVFIWLHVRPATSLCFVIGIPMPRWVILNEFYSKYHLIFWLFHFQNTVCFQSFIFKGNWWKHSLVFIATIFINDHLNFFLLLAVLSYFLVLAFSESYML